MAITMEMIKELRIRTGAGVLNCKKALAETNGNVEKAAEYLREKGIASAAKKSSRIAAEGLVHSYIHMGGRIGVLLEVNCETDFVVKTDEFKGLVNNIAMHIAAMNPEYVSREEVPADAIEKEKEILTAQALNEGKPANIVEKMVQGRLEKFYSQKVLLDQPYVRDDSVTIQQLVTEKIAKIGENIKVRRFVRYEMGEGLEKKVDNFVEEVMSYQK
ncbi:MAG: translation elongation factor Ts [Halanaerobiales bacterium]|nr:translation elongation factor Ts [Halanaerobiales bacterium]